MCCKSRSAGRSRRSTRSTPARPTPPLSAISCRPVCARRSRILYRNILRPSETHWIRCSSGSMCCWSCASAPSARPRASAIRRRNSCARLPPGRSCRRTADARRWKKAAPRFCAAPLSCGKRNPVISINPCSSGRCAISTRTIPMKRSRSTRWRRPPISAPTIFPAYSARRWGRRSSNT